MSGLIYPTDLDAWHRWSRRRPLRAARALLRKRHSRVPPVVLRNSDDAPRLIVAISSDSPSARAALLAPLRWLASSTPVAIVSEVDLCPHLPEWHLDALDWRPLMGDAGAVIGDGNFLDHGHDVWADSKGRGIPYFVSQHGAITPYAPPLPPEAHLLAWSTADGDFWRSGRSDVEVHQAGSQLLWEAAESAAAISTSRARLTYLGQGHSAEMGRTRMVEAAARFCRKHDAVYRPHPSERDRLSRVTHSCFQRLGVTVDGDGQLNELTGPVVSVFSTGVLEAAAQGRPAWVDLPRPPTWLGEFWERYGMHRFGDSPTPAHARPAVEPARRVAEILEQAIG